MTRLQFRILALVAFSLFVAFIVSGSGPGPANAKPISELIGPDTPPDPSPLIPILLLAAALGIFVGYTAIFFLLPWARITVLLSTVLMAVGQVMIPAHNRHGGMCSIFAAGFVVASLGVVIISFSVASTLFQRRAQPGASKALQATAAPPGS
ncbi:MAG: hypothetical protein ABSG04_13380 [Verrucomicrobiota bacterium]|jgi:hypothetical protein